MGEINGPRASEEDVTHPHYTLMDCRERVMARHNCHTGARCAPPPNTSFSFRVAAQTSRNPPLHSNAIVPLTSEARVAVVYPLHHGLKPRISRLSVSWSRGNSLRVAVFREAPNDSGVSDEEAGGKVVEVKFGVTHKDVDDAQWRRIAYGSVSPFSLLQSRRNSIMELSKMSMSSSAYHSDWWEYVMEYSQDISSLLDNGEPIPASVIEDPWRILKIVAEPTHLRASWELLVIFSADRDSHAWLPERLVDWLVEYDIVFSGTLTTVHSILAEFQKESSSLQVVEDDSRYWEVISSALAVGWLEIVVKLLRLHGSYQLDQLSKRETENGLVEAVAILVSKRPRLRPDLENGRLGECFKLKPDFIKAWEKWRAQIDKLDSSVFWVQCDHRQTREGLKNMLQIMQGKTGTLCTSTCHWMELYISHFLYVRPFTVVVLAECSRAFGPWMLAHAIELLTAGSDQAEITLREERHNLGGISIEELHRVSYAQVLSSHALTWQIAPIYLTLCMKQGMGLLEILLYKQPVQHNQTLLKTKEICGLYGLDYSSSNIMKIAGIHRWKHGRKGSGVFWLQQAQDEFPLNRIAQQLFDFVGRSISDESFKQWEGLIELLGSESKIAGGLDFLHKSRDFKKSLQQVHDGKTTDAALQAVEFLMLLMKSPSTPQRFWLPLLHDSAISKVQLKLLSWKEQPLLNVAQTNLLMNKLQELSKAASIFRGSQLAATGLGLCQACSRHKSWPGYP